VGGDTTVVREPKSQIDLTGARQHLADVLAACSEDILQSWLKLAGDHEVERLPELPGYLRSLLIGLQDIFSREDWTVAQAVVDALADRRARSLNEPQQGMQRALLGCRMAVRPYLDPGHRTACEELLLDALHECLFRFFESFQGLRIASENERLHSRIIKSLVMALEARDPYTKGHSISVVLMAQKIGDELAIDPARAYLSGLLHDVGKVGVPDRVLMKSGPLTPEEWRLMEAHPRLGASILTPIRLYPDVVGAVLSHHENHDGTGYPYGLAGDEIPPIARIIRVVDSFDAMTSARAYRSSRNAGEAIDEIIRLRGVLYDPAVVDAFAAVMDEPGVARELSLASLQIDLGELSL
jgi:putative nucleotidyltransferase with HDIG domain